MRPCVCWEQPACHGDDEGVRDGAVLVGGPALVLSVVVVIDAVEGEPAAVFFHVGAGLAQAAVLLPPLHLRGGAADGRRRR